jgi:predicted RNA-binding protein YlxR (DUF448 family)
MNAKEAPTRTCVGCRRRSPVAELARLALADVDVDADADAGASGRRVVLWGRTTGRPTGRGASLHPDEACLRAALKTGAFARAFRSTPVRAWKLDEADLLQQITAATAAMRSVNRKKP